MIKQTAEALRVRAHQLQQKDAIGNMRIINKLKRKIRKIENQE